jgi:hypothetical protein
MDIEQTEDEEFSFAFAISDEALEGAGNADRLAVSPLETVQRLVFALHPINALQVPPQRAQRSDRLI